jgi:hypothetical protein
MSKATFSYVCESCDEAFRWTTTDSKNPSCGVPPLLEYQYSGGPGCGGWHEKAKMKWPPMVRAQFQLVLTKEDRVTMDWYGDPVEGT